MFSLNDKNKFIEAIENEKFKEKNSWGDVSFYSKKVYEGSDPEWDDYAYIAINGTCAYWIERVWVGSKFKAIPFLEKVIEESQESSFANTPNAEFITDGNMGGLSVSFPKELRNELRKSGLSPEIAHCLNGTLCMKGELTNNQCSVQLKLFNEEGKEFSAETFSGLWNMNTTINEKALALLGKDEFIISAVSLKDFDWDSYANLLAGAMGLSQSEKSELCALLNYFEKIDGTVACSIGLTNGLESFFKLCSKNDPLSQISTTFVAEIEDGETEHILESMKYFMEKAQIPYDNTASGVSINLESFGLSGDLYVKCIDNFITIANHSIKENNENVLTKGSNFSDYSCAVCIGLSKNNKLLRELNIKHNIKLGVYCKPNNMETSLVLDIDGDSESGIIAKVARMVLGIIEQSDDLERRFNDIYCQYEVVAVDTCAVWDEYEVDSVCADIEEYDIEYVDSLAY